MKKLHKVQLFINSHYEAIKLVLLVIIISLIGYLIISGINSVLDTERYRTKQTEDIIRENKERTDEVMKALEENNKARTRQFQAMCLILVEVAGEEALNKLDPPLDERCRSLSQELENKETPSNPTPSINLQPTYNPQQTAPQQRLEQPGTVEPTPEQPNQPTPPQNPPQRSDRVLDRLRNVLGIGG